MLYRRRPIFRVIPFIYIGLVLIIVPSMFLGRVNTSELLTELTIRLGEAVLVAGVIWYFLDTFYGRLEEILVAHRAFASMGIKSLKELNTKNIEQATEYIPRSLDITLQFNVYEANRHTIELLDTLQQHKRQRVRILATGISREGLKDVSRRTDLPFETRMMMELLERRLSGTLEQGHVEIRISSDPTFNTLILSERIVLVVVSLGAKKEDAILLDVDISSQLAEQYKQQFEELWRNAAT